MRTIMALSLALYAALYESLVGDLCGSNSENPATVECVTVYRAVYKGPQGASRVLLRKVSEQRLWRGQ